MIFHFVSQNKLLWIIQNFDRVPEIDKAIADHQQAIKGALLNEITLEEVGTNRLCLKPVMNILKKKSLTKYYDFG
jgi:hypothetical protein